MKFIGNKKSVNLLEQALERGTLNHAYLFSGPERVGKFSLARKFALAAIADGKIDAELEEFDKNAQLDLIVVEPEIVEKNGISKQRDISIDSIKEAKQGLSLYPYHGKYKVLIVNDAHRMNNTSQNALLKIMEEPNQTTMLILITHEVDRILPTILSRLQVVNFGLVTDDDMHAGFKNVEDFSLESVELAMGRPGLAKFLNENEDDKNFRADALQQLHRMKKSSLNDKFKLAEEFSKDSMKTIDKLNVWIWALRKDATLDPLGSNGASFLSIEKIQKSMATLKSTNSNARLVLETLFMDM
jgi:DNA polymerase-3 subunit delta'